MLCLDLGVLCGSWAGGGGGFMLLVRLCGRLCSLFSLPVSGSQFCTGKMLFLGMPLELL